MLKAYKYRIYPNSEQRIQIAKTFGCCRFVYNQTLAYRKEIYEKEKKSVSKTDCNNYCNRELKKDYEWLKEIDKFALTNAIYNMDAAYQKFFKEHAGYPKFKSKHDNHKSYTTNFTNGNIAVDFETGKIKLPKLKAVKARLHREYSGQIKSATVSQVSSGKYYVSILVETEHKELTHTNHNIGIDLGIKDLCITSDGKVYENLKIIKKYEKQLVKLQRQLSHKGKRSKNYYKTKKKIALCHEKIRNIRKDYLHKVSHEIISENQVIVSENLQIKNMVKNHHLAKAISDVSWYELTRQLEYKAKWNGRKYIKIDTFYASSQLCSVCGYQNPDTKDLMLYIFYMSMLDRFLYERENLELKQQMNIYERQIRSDIENNRKIRTIKHDMKHHIREINDLLMKDKIQQAKDYLHQISDDIINAQNIYNTGNEAFDGILNFYAEKYMNKSLELAVSVAIPENLEINIYDVNIILGNLLDNALENALDNSKVSMDIKYTAGMIHISMSNLYDGSINKIDGHIISKKDDKDNHGYGLDSIKRIVDKYDGSMIKSYENGQFEVDIIIYLE